MSRVWLLMACALLAPVAYGQNEAATLRGLNAQVLRLRVQAGNSNGATQSAAHSQSVALLQRRQQLLQQLMSSAPARALELALPDLVLSDLAATFPETADALERRATIQGTLYYEIRDNVGLSGHQEVRWLKSNNQMINLNFIKDPGNGKCNDQISAAGVISGGTMVVESSVTINTAAGCSNQGAQKIAVILANFPGYALPTAITPDFVRGVMLGNAASGSQSSPDRSISDFWLQNSDGKTWVNDTGSGALTIVPVTLDTNYDYCNNAAGMRTAAYAAADGVIDYNTFSRVVIVVPNNGSCSGTAGVASIGCWSGECPGDGACNISWTWWRADQMSTRGSGVMLGSHEMGHNLGVSHSGSRYHGSEVVGNIGVAGFRTEYNDRFATMGNWNYGFYNAPHALNTLGWLTTSNVQTVTGTGVYTIQGYQTRPAGVKALKVARGTGTTNAYYYIAYYPDLGNYIGGLNTTVHNGVIIHYNDSATPSLKTDLLDFSPTIVDTTTTTPDFSNPVLPLGATWTDPYKDVQIQVMNIDTVNNTATVNIIFTPPPCTASNPTVTFLTSSATVSPAGGANYSVRVLNNDSISCSTRTFNLSAALTAPEPSISLNYQTAAVSLAPGASGDVVLTAATSSSTPVGTYVIDASATSGTNSGSTAVDASLTVQISPPATPTTSATSVYSGSGKNKVFQYIRVSWTNVASETGYEIQRCAVTTVNKVTTCVYAPLTSVGANVTTINDVPPGVGTYRYQVRAVNSITSLVSNWSTAAQASRQ